MAEIVRMPKLSDTMTEGVVAEWHKKVGDTVAEGELLAEIETDKATLEFDSFYDGVLLHIGLQQGEATPVNEIIAIIGEKGEDISALLKEESASKTTETVAETPAIKKEEVSPEPTPTPAPVVQQNAAEEVVSVDTPNGRIFVSPLAKKMAEERHINLSNVNGSGEHGRIVKRDIENYTPATTNANAPVFSAPVGNESFTDEPLSQMRKAIARTLSNSKFSAPHFYLKMEVNMDNAIEARKAINAEEGVKISFNDIIVKATAAALRKNPKVNVDWLGDKIRYNNHIHIGVAVAVEEGLVVPVVKFTDTKGFAQIGAEIKELAVKAKSKKLLPSDMEGNTFAISNLGMYGIEDFTSIIYPPNGCILSVGGIKQTPIVKNGEIVPGNIMTLSLSCDHRAVDGATGSEFLRTLKGYLENPVRIMV
ncbi:pyruvate dehydrogenase complex dihydrolipoamide acetyltransferase [Putridiphycobacter roseus]|uniref:Acetyltransferase component of pyruvate dehydrogenase complex n=1 Tax=Putridiphycobacter roseus TaxID=2219161 RepID=A0A2W1MZW6_9FLAO|nr:pyruvate dehydrogenase complex dihydrolipoamide acetyltransferase [Putridiphycobacter roseus]PZE16820.1 pyruvate dehydrogenase complex dihydrolipoamide acetyltransferase [Putridiphycobacter roseus]